MRTLTRWVALACLALAAPGCSNSERPAFLSLGTAPPGGAFFVVGGAIAEVLNEQGDTGRWRFTAEATMGSQENIRRLARQQIDLAMSNAAITYFAVRGEGGWPGPQPVRSVMTLAPNVAMFITDANSGIRRIAELRGKRVVIGPPGAGFEYFVEPILQAHGVRLKDLKPLYATQSGAVDMLADGSVAAVFIGGAVPTASISQAAASQDIFFLPFEPEVRKRLVADYPFFHPATVPALTYRGQTNEFQGLNVGSMHLITSAQHDDDLVYRLTRALYENRARVVEKHPAGKAINPQNVVRPTGTEFHPGAIKYYREIGIWPESPPTPSAAKP
jgi:hypothetical protein